MLCFINIGCVDDSTYPIDNSSSIIVSSASNDKLYCDEMGNCYQTPIVACASQPYGIECYASCNLTWNMPEFYTYCKEICDAEKKNVVSQKYSFCDRISEKLRSSSSGGVDKYGHLTSCDGYGCIVDSRDGQIYRTVTIGGQTWMAENLNYVYQVNGVSYGNYCYGNNIENCKKYGRLYTYGAMVDSANRNEFGKQIRGICPKFWHIPTELEFKQLMNVVGENVAGTKLKSIEGWDDDGGGEDAYAFSILPIGQRTLHTRNSAYSITDCNKAKEEFGGTDNVVISCEGNVLILDSGKGVRTCFASSTTWESQPYNFRTAILCFSSKLIGASMSSLGSKYYYGVGDAISIRCIKD